MKRSILNRKMNLPAITTKLLITLLIVSASVGIANAQNNIGIGTTTPHPSAVLEISTKTGTQGLLIPRLHITDTTLAAPVTAPANWLFVFNDTYLSSDKTAGTGLYYWSPDRGGRWIFVLSQDRGNLIVNNQVINMLRDSVNNWYTNNTILHDSIYNTIKAKTDSLTADNYINVTGGDSSVMNRVKLNLNIKNISDTLTKASYFIDSLVSNNNFIDSLVINNRFRDSVTNFATTTITNNNIFRDSITNIVRDSVSNWYTDNTILHDSIYNTIKAKTDSLTADNYINVTGGDSSVMNRVKLNLNIKNISDTLTKASYFIDSLVNNNNFIDSLVTNNRFRDSVTNFATTTITNNNIFRDSITNIVRDSVSNWYTNNTILHDSIYNTIKAKTDSLTADNYINVTGGDSSVMNRVKLNLNIKNISDTLTKASYFVDSLIANQTFRDSIINMSSDTVRNTIKQLYAAIVTTSGPTYAVSDSDYTIIVRGLGMTGACAIALPDPTTQKGRILNITVLSQQALGNVSFTLPITYGEDETGTTVAGTTWPATMFSSTGSGNKMTIQSDGNTWVLISAAL